MRNLLVVAILFLSLGAFAEDLATQIYGNGQYTTEEYSLGQRRAEQFGRDIKDMPSLAQKYDNAFDGIFHLAYLNLKHQGYVEEANQLRSDWQEHRGEVKRIVDAQVAGYAIGDFAGISKFIDTEYAKLQNLFGYQVCHALRLDDLLTLNDLNVVFNPCKYGQTQFLCVFAGDIHENPASPDPHRGALPVLAFWGTDITCGIATYGLGWISMVCGAGATIVEWATDRYLAVPIGQKIYSAVCN